MLHWQVYSKSTGLRSVTNRLTTPVHGLEDVFITVSLDGPLMSEALRRELNPLIIKVSSASSMPSTPQSFRELSRRCMPVYTAYTFFKEPMYESCRKPHGRNIYWEDVNVELLGKYLFCFLPYNMFSLSAQRATYRKNKLLRTERCRCRAV